MAGDMRVPAPVTWAQRDSIVYLTFCVEDCKDPQVKVEADKVYFKGTGGTEKKDYENTVELYQDVDVEKSRHFIRDRNIEVILVKKEKGPFWPRLLKEKTKQHWVKVDFTKWKDEDDSDIEDGVNPNIDDVMSQLGGLGGGAGQPTFDDLDNEEDSDDEELPDLE